MMTCPVCGAQVPNMSAHIEHNSEGMKMWDSAKTLDDILANDDPRKNKRKKLKLPLDSPIKDV